MIFLPVSAYSFRICRLGFIEPPAANGNARYLRFHLIRHCYSRPPEEHGRISWVSVQPFYPESCFWNSLHLFSGWAVTGTLGSSAAPPVIQNNPASSQADCASVRCRGDTVSLEGNRGGAWTLAAAVQEGTAVRLLPALIFSLTFSFAFTSEDPRCMHGASGV